MWICKRNLICSLLVAALLAIACGAAPLIVGDVAYLPWHAPSRIFNMIQDGNLTLVFNNNPAFVKRDNGATNFNLKLAHQFEYSYSTLNRDGKRFLKVAVKDVEPTVSVEHLVRLPEPYRVRRVWRGRLLRHEFDHVAISLDPRPKMILEYLATHLPTIERELKAGELACDAICRNVVNAEIEKRRESVEQLIQFNYVQLDKVSRHGTVAVPNRAEFFRSMYQIENLSAARFPYDASGVIFTPGYQQAKLRFLETDPVDVQR